MKETVIVDIHRAGAIDNAKGAFVQLVTNDGPCELRFTYEDGERLIAALHEARKQVEAERVRSGIPPAPASRRPERWETAIDPVEQTAILRTHFTDGTSEHTRIPRAEIARIARFLEQALKRFEAGAEMRQ